MPSSRKFNPEQKIYESYLYPGTEVFKNKLDVRDEKLLEQAELFFNVERIRQPLPKQAQELTYKGFLAIHHHLFQDVYTWAGKQRDYTTGRGPAPFAKPEFIKPWMDEQFAKLKQQNYLRGLSKNEFAEKIAPIVNEINAAHPFIEGNGRTQRLWLRIVAEQAGHRLDLTNDDREKWYEASRIGFELMDHKPMIELLKESLNRDKTQIQQQYPGTYRKSLSHRIDEVRNQHNKQKRSPSKENDKER
ncbi:Fic/DOC family protein [Paenibacillus tuaregi]|uniref:Fic/DOC family protein n=1 Tax=Paenibacillus tuaregi TaxID=1816681 RepID=UPI0008392D28|nr:Fic family protein [Paenibacillus tuaregi]